MPLFLRGFTPSKSLLGVFRLARPWLWMPLACTISLIIACIVGLEPQERLRKGELLWGPKKDLVCFFCAVCRGNRLGHEDKCCKWMRMLGIFQGFFMWGHFVIAVCKVASIYDFRASLKRKRRHDLFCEERTIRVYDKSWTSNILYQVTLVA